MAEAFEQEAVWHNDGHSISLKFKGTELVVTPNPCPYESHEERYCSHEDTRCLFEYFVSLYGAECNMGEADAQPSMEVAWAVLGNTRFLDESQLWFIPVDDDAFASFLQDKLAPRDV